MLINAYEVDDQGFLVDVYVVTVDENGNIQDEVEKDLITVEMPYGLYRAKWTGSEWVEGMSKEEIDELTKVVYEPTIEDYMLDMDFRLSSMELGM